MAYDSALVFNSGVGSAGAAPLERSDDFRRFERIVFLIGASAVGGLAGFVGAMTLGRLDLWMVMAAALPFFALALHLSAQMLSEGISKQAYGCATAAMLHVAALLAWPITALFAPLSAMTFWIAPVAALTALVMLASCWQGTSRGVFRLSVLGLVVAGLAVNQGTMILLGA